MTWLGFAGVFAAFFATHSIPVRPPVRARLVAALGPRGFTLAYSALSLAMLALLIHAAGRAPYVQLWPTQPWQYPVVHLGMLAASLIVALGVGRPNPFSFGGARNDRYDPARPGITRLVRHPVLAALALWAGMHLLPNGDLAHVFLFGVLLTFAIAGRRLIDRRKRREMGPEAWQALRDAVASGPLVPRPLSRSGTALRVALALAAYAALVALHPLVIGIPVA